MFRGSNSHHSSNNPRMYGYPKVVNVLKDFNMPKASTSKASLPKKAKVVNK